MLIIFFIIAFWLLPLITKAVTSTIELPAGFTANIIEQVTALFSNFNSYIVLIIAILLIAIVIEILIGALRK